jgi:hypothetical protein
MWVEMLCPLREAYELPDHLAEEKVSETAIDDVIEDDPAACEPVSVGRSETGSKIRRAW